MILVLILMSCDFGVNINELMCKNYYKEKVGKLNLIAGFCVLIINELLQEMCKNY